MPEIVEVKLYSDFIKKKINNHELLKINILQGRYKTHGPFKLYKKLINKLPTTIDEIKTKGKFMYLKLNNGLFIGVSLGLSGGWLFQKKNTNKYSHVNFINTFDKDIMNTYLKNAINHLNIEFVFDKGSLFFYDQLSFGSVKIFETENELNNKLKLIGFDIMDPNTCLELFIEKINKKTNQEKVIGNVLLDQKVIAGVGNYLRADLLWLTKISPFRKVKDLIMDEIIKLYKNIRLLTWTLYNYDKAIELKIISKKDKLPIDYKNEFLIYNRIEDIYGNKIIKEKLYEGSNIRYIYWVDKLQK